MMMIIIITRPPEREFRRANVLPVLFSFFAALNPEIPRPIALKLCHMIENWLYFIN